MIDKDLQKVKEIFLAKDLDEEDYQDNMDKIDSWEGSLRENEDFGNWQESDITKEIIKKVRETYKDLALELINNRELTEKQRLVIYSKQDACIFLLSLVYKDVKSNIEAIKREIHQTLKVAS